MNENTLPRPTVANLLAGKVVRAGYVRRGRDMMDTNRFVGFKVSEHYFSRLSHMKEFFGVKNLKDLETKVSYRGMGEVTAEWYCTDGKYSWAAYLWEGSFRVGSSADRLSLKAA